MDKNGVQSFASEPVMVANEKLITTYEIESSNPKSDLGYQGFAGTGFTEITTALNKTINIVLKVTEPGLYAIDFKYANGNGPTNTENKCAIRTLSVDGKAAGTSVFPQRGKNEWSNWGYSNSVQVQLTKGDHTVRLSLEDHNDNMNGDINQAMLDNMRVIKLK